MKTEGQIKDRIEMEFGRKIPELERWIEDVQKTAYQEGKDKEKNTHSQFRNWSNHQPTY